MLVCPDNAIPFTCERSPPKEEGAQPGATRRKGSNCDGFLEHRARRVQTLVLPQVQRSSGLRPVCFAMRASILGPISTLSWKAKT